MTKHNTNQPGHQPPVIKHEASIEDAEVRRAEEKPAVGIRLATPLALLAVIGVSGGLVLGYQQLKEMRASLSSVNQALSQTGRKLQSLQSGLAFMQTRLDSQNSLFETRKAEIDAQQQRFSEHQTTLQQERERLEEQAGHINQALAMVQQKAGLDASDWMLTEAQYLLSLANNRLHLEANVPTALKALEAASERLRLAGDSGGEKVRQRLAAEIAALRSIKQMDRVQMSTRLVEIVQQIESLPLADTGSDLEQKMNRREAQSILTEERERSLKTLLQDSWQGFKSVMVVRRRDRPLSAMLSPEQRYFVKQNLRLQLEAARLALLRRDQQLYSSSLQTAEQWVVDYYDTEQQAIHSLLEEVKQLQQLNLRPTLPVISGSLRALREGLNETGQPGDGR